MTTTIFTAMAMAVGVVAKVAAGTASFFGCHQAKEPKNIKEVLKKKN